MWVRLFFIVFNNIYSVLGKRIKRKNNKMCWVNILFLVIVFVKSFWFSLEVKVFIFVFLVDFCILFENGGVIIVSIDEEMINIIFFIVYENL